MNKDLRELEKYFNLKFNDFGLLEKAMTHSSFANENNKKSNERLEFVGDAVLDLAVAKFLFDELDEAEGVLTKKRAQEVCEQSLYEYARSINLGDYLLLGKGEEMSNGREKPALLADAFEALLGAVYVDKGYLETYKILEKVVFPTILKNINEEDNDYKSKLQELVQSDKRTLEYKIISETGPAHSREFTSRVHMDESIIMGEGIGKSKKEAEQNAAKATLEKLAKGNRR